VRHLGNERRQALISETEIILKAVAIGIGGTVILDLWALLLQRLFNIPATNWAMVGRWIGNMPQGQFVQKSMAIAPPVSGERAIGWIAHYIIGAGYGLLLAALWGTEWLKQPTILPPIILAIGLLVAPFFIMMPGMGMGMAGSKTPKPNTTRLKSVVGHSIFGLGMYVTALLIQAARNPGAL